jgi:hypothetical protein
LQASGGAWQACQVSPEFAAADGERAAGDVMNWKLGFFRIWVVACICWAAFVGWLFYNATVVSSRMTATQEACVADRRADPSLGNVFDCFDKGIRFEDLSTFGSLVTKHLALAIGPMIGALVLWFVAVWVVAGFNRRRT